MLPARNISPSYTVLFNPDANALVYYSSFESRYKVFVFGSFESEHKTLTVLSCFLFWVFLLSCQRQINTKLSNHYKTQIYRAIYEKLVSNKIQFASVSIRAFSCLLFGRYDGVANASTHDAFNNTYNTLQWKMEDGCQ